MSKFLCSACRAKGKSLPAGSTLLCEHNGARLQIDAKGRRTWTFLRQRDEPTDERLTERMQ